MFKTQGFLSDQVSDLTDEINRQYPGLWSLACEVNEFANQLQYSLSIHTGVPSELMGAPLYLRVLTNYQALLLLCKRGMLDQAYATLRVLVETLFYLAAISSEGGFALEYLKYEEHQRRDILSKLRRYKESQDATDPEIETAANKIKEIENTIIEESIKKFSYENVAHRAGLHDWYDTVYAHTSSYVHTSARSLESYVVLKEGSNEMRELKNEPVIDRIHLPLSAGIDAMLLAVSSVCSIFGMDEPPAAIGFRGKCQSLVNSHG
jgi:hypothetical protein